MKINSVTNQSLLTNMASALSTNNSKEGLKGKSMREFCIRSLYHHALSTVIKTRFPLKNIKILGIYYIMLIFNCKQSKYECIFILSFI